MKKIGKLNLRARMIALNSSLIALTLLIIMGISLFSFTRINEDNINTLTRQILDQVVENVQSYTGELERIALLANYDRNLQAYLNGRYSGEAEKYELVSGVLELMESVRDLRDDVESVIILPEQGDIIAYSSGGRLKGNYDFYSQPFYSNMAGELTLYRPHVQDYFTSGNALVFSAVQDVKNFDSDERMGVIMLDLNLNALRNICSNIEYGQDGYVMIVDSDLNYIFHPDYSHIYKTVNSELDEEPTTDDLIMARVFEDRDSFDYVTPEGETLRVSSKRVPGIDWSVIGVYPMDEFLAKQARITGMIVFAGVICIAVGVLGTVVTSNMIFDPLTKLRRIMKKAEEGEFEPAADYGRDDEIGSLNESYNSMIERINDLMQRAVKDEKEKRRIELKLLQAQINPHFLYNTLDSIVWMAETKNENAAVMADALAKLFRISLAKGREIITVKEEEEHLRNYLTIQKMRYSKKFDYEIAISPELHSLSILKLTLQPLVENALYHGVKTQRKKGVITVTGQREGEDVLFKVADDGAGIPPEKLKTILTEEVAPDKRLGGIGLKNVNERLKLYYGEGYGISFKSEMGEGTTVFVRIPAVPYTEDLNEGI